VGKKLSCPYCYQRFKEKEIWFRCSGRLGTTGQKCASRRDEKLAKRMGFAGLLPPAFSGDGRKLSVVHADCQAETNYRLCPECHSQLPVHFGKIDNRLIALVGAKESGKTVYITVLLHELMNKVGVRFDASVLGADDETREDFRKKYESPLYDDHRLAPPTQRATATGTGSRRPLVFTFTVSGRNVSRGRERRTVLSFFDTAGEDLNSSDSVEQNVRYLTSADGIILLLDPLTMRGARAEADPQAPRPIQGPGLDLPVNVLDRITQLLHGALHTKPSQRIRTPVAVAFTKLDALQKNLPDGSPLRRDPPEDAAFDAQDSLEVHEHVRALLDEWDGPSIDQILRHNYSQYRYFGLSSLGAIPTRDRRVATEVIQSYRAPDPFLWLLSEFGTIPKTRA
jgi:hypothetical protein